MKESPLDLLLRLKANEARRKRLDAEREKLNEEDSDARESLKLLFEEEKTRMFWLDGGPPTFVSVYKGRGGSYISIGFHEPEDPRLLAWPQVVAEPEPLAPAVKVEPYVSAVVGGDELDDNDTDEFAVVPDQDILRGRSFEMPTADIDEAS